MIPHIITVDGVTVFLRNQPVTVSSTDKAFDEVVSAVKSFATEEEIEDILWKTKRSVQRVLNTTRTPLVYNEGQIFYEGRVIHGYVVDKLIQLVALDEDVTVLANFLEKLQKNPSAQVVEDLYRFLEHGKMPLTSSGNFLAYKAVRQDYKDIHSGQFDNSIGSSPPRLARNQVDDRRYVTCSYGYHVCSFGYLPHFAHADGHVMVCEVDPADVVAIPNDYNDTKMRVTFYKVVGEVENWYENNRDVLSERPILNYDDEDESEDFDMEFDESNGPFSVTNEEGKIVATFWNGHDAASWRDENDMIAVIDASGVQIYPN